MQAACQTLAAPTINTLQTFESSAEVQNVQVAVQFAMPMSLKRQAEYMRNPAGILFTAKDT